MSEQIIVTIDVETTPEDVLAAAGRAEKLFLKGMQRGSGDPTVGQVMLLFVNLVKSSLVGELCFDAEVEEIAEILEVLLDTPGYTFSDEFPFTKEQMLAYSGEVA